MQSISKPSRTCSRYNHKPITMHYKKTQVGGANCLQRRLPRSPQSTQRLRAQHYCNSKYIHVYNVTASKACSANCTNRCIRCRLTATMLRSNVLLGETAAAAVNGIKIQLAHRKWNYYKAVSLYYQITNNNVHKCT